MIKIKYCLKVSLKTINTYFTSIFLLGHRKYFNKKAINFKKTAGLW